MVKRAPTQLRRVVVFLVALAIFFTGAGVSKAAVDKGTFRMAIHWSPSRDWVDPSISGFSGTGYFMLYMFHDALLKPMPGEMYGPCVAESWTAAGSSPKATTEAVLRGSSAQT